MPITVQPPVSAEIRPPAPPIQTKSEAQRPVQYNEARVLIYQSCANYSVMVSKYQPEIGIRKIGQVCHSKQTRTEMEEGGKPLLLRSENVLC